MSDMIVEAKLIAIRPSVEVEFRPPVPAGLNFLEFVKVNYIDTGKILQKTEIVSEDQLTLTTTTIWKNDQERKNYSEEFIVKAYFDNLVKYRTQNNIITQWVNKEFDGETVIREWSGTF